MTSHHRIDFPKTDYHSHTTRCGHATGSMQEYVRRAREQGLEEFGFSDHSPWMTCRRGWRAAMESLELPEYVADVQRLQAEHNSSSFQIRLGMEMDFVPFRLGEAREAVDRYPWDYLIGSVHHIGFWTLPDPSDADYHDRYAPEDVCDAYFELTRAMIRERFCDIIAHMDVIKKFGNRTAGGYLPWIDPLIPEMKASGSAVEINTSGIDHPIAEPYPGWDIIAALVAADVPLVINSDSHKPEDVARHFAPTLERLRALGARRLARFERRQIDFYAI